MELYNPTTKTTITLDELKSENTNISFPSIITDEVLNSFGYVKVAPYPEPTCTQFQVAIRDGVAELADGLFYQKWAVVPKYSEYTDASGVVHTVLEQEQQELARINAEARELAKYSRQQQVDNIKVTTQSGKTFDGDETSQTRMARAIIAMQATNTPTCTWVLADNVPTQATIAELTEALALAGAAQAAIWVI